MDTKKRISSSYKKDEIELRSKNNARHFNQFNLISYRKYKQVSHHIGWEEKRISKYKKRPFQINISNNLVIEVRHLFKKINQKIRDALYILSLKDDWDDQGSKGYSKETFCQACSFIVKYFTWVWDEFRIIPDAPELLPGPNGSIDILWQNDKYELLVNCKEAPDNIATFYGDDKNKTKIEGEFEMLNPNLGVFLCLLVNK